MNRISVVWPLLLVLALTLLAGCGGGSSPDSTAPLSADNINLIFVVSPDLAYNAPGDINPSTANLTNQGLQRSLLMATYLKQQVLGTANVTGIYVLEPMTHLQTANNYPDMAGIGYIQQFALLNQITLTGAGGPGSALVTGNSYPLNASYASSGSLPSGVAAPFASCPGCQGLDFNDTEGNNAALVTGIISAKAPGFYVFSAPWETISALLANIKRTEGYNLTLPATYMGPNYVYAISIAPSGNAGLATYNSNLNPPSTYPVLPRRCPALHARHRRLSPSQGPDGLVAPKSGGNQYQRDGLHDPARRGASGERLGRRQLSGCGAMARAGPSERSARQNIKSQPGLFDRPRTGLSRRSGRFG